MALEKDNTGSDQANRRDSNSKLTGLVTRLISSPNR
jgi:hypothetical protein